MRRVVQSRNQNDNTVVQQYKQSWHFKNRKWYKAFKKTSGYNILLSDSEAHSMYICPKARFEKREIVLIMHKQTWQHYTEVPEEKQSVVSKKQSVVLLWQQKEHFS